MNDVYYHKYCKASWAISTAESLEAALAIKNEKDASNYKVSFLNLLDCDYSNNACI